MKHHGTLIVLVAALLLWPGDHASGDEGMRPHARRFSVNVGFEVDSAWLSLRGAVVLGRRAAQTADNPETVDRDVWVWGAATRVLARARVGWTAIRVIGGTTSRVAIRRVRHWWRSSTDAKGNQHADRRGST
ncbi:MAG: hypothetical protein ACE5EO_09815 [Candidatus Krumholzibacteriia bacterium]